MRVSCEFDFPGPMTLRIVYVPLTILGLLACPFNCMSQERAAVEASSSVQGCSGCSHRCPSSNEKSDYPQPESESSEEECDSGACRSSLGDSPRRPVTDYQVMLSLASASPCLNSLDIHGGLGQFLDNSAGPFRPSPAFGRELRLENRSLLL